MNDTSTEAPTRSDEQAAPPERIQLPPLPLRARIPLLALGWLLLVLGVPGLFLPGLQGILMIVVGLALASLGSDTVHRFLERRLQRHPRLWERLERLRHSLHSRFGGKS